MAKTRKTILLKISVGKLIILESHTFFTLCSSFISVDFPVPIELVYLIHIFIFTMYEAKTYVVPENEESLSPLSQN
jgi:hypothetical protein